MADYKAVGGCMCGGVKFEYTAPLTKVHNCHCSMCRKNIGASFGTFGIVPNTHFKILKEDKLVSYRSSKMGCRLFCGTCGASLFYKADSISDKTFVALGTVDGDPGTPVEFHMFASSKAPWVNIDDGLPKCDGFELMLDH